MGRPRFRLEDVKIDGKGDDGIFGSLSLGNENDDCGDGDRTFWKVFKKIDKILCGCEDYCGCEDDCGCDNDLNCCDDDCGSHYSRPDCPCFYD